MQTAERVGTDYWSGIAAPLLLELADTLAQAQPADPVEHLLHILNAKQSSSHTHVCSSNSAGRANEGADIDADHPADGNAIMHTRSALVLPSIVPSSYRYARVSQCYSPSLMHGWVQQPSPCCAAASIASACNALHFKQRNDPSGSMCLLDALTILQSVTESSMQSIRQRISSLAHQLDVSAMEDETMERLQQTFPAYIDARASDALKALRELCNTKIAHPATSTEHKQYRALRDAVWPKDDTECDLATERTSFPLSDAIASHNAGYNTIAGTDGNEAGDDLLVFETQPACNPKDDVTELLRKRIGLERLRLPERPRTAVIGNWGILNSTKHMTSTRCEVLLAKTGKGKHVRRSVSSKDSQSKIGEQWNLLFAALNDENTVLIFHLSNHFAPLYAARSYYDAESAEWSREVLTARKGQKPKSWLAFSEVRSQLLKWGGHAIMALSICTPSNLPWATGEQPYQPRNSM